MTVMEFHAPPEQAAAMSWTRYLLHDFWTAREFNRIDNERRTANRVRRRRVRLDGQRIQEQSARIEQLEDDLGEAMLVVRTLADLCIRKGLISEAEFAAHAEHLDGLDGVVDGKLGRAEDSDSDPGTT